MAQGCEQVTFAYTRFSGGHNVNGIGGKCTTAQVLHLLLDVQRKPIEMQRVERLVRRQSGLAEQPSNAALFAHDAFTLHHFCQVGFIGQVGARGFHRQLGEAISHSREMERSEHGA